MLGILIADQDPDTRRQIADIFIDSGYNVMVTTSAANALHGILKKAAQVVILGSQFDELNAVDLIPLLKQCDRNLTIILVANEITLPLLRKARREGIFYHALKQDKEDIRQAVQCAFDNIAQQRANRSW